MFLSWLRHRAGGIGDDMSGVLIRVHVLRFKFIAYSAQKQEPGTSGFRQNVMLPPGPARSEQIHPVRDLCVMHVKGLSTREKRRAHMPVEM